MKGDFGIVACPRCKIATSENRRSKHQKYYFWTTASMLRFHQNFRLSVLKRNTTSRIKVKHSEISCIQFTSYTIKRTKFLKREWMYRIHKLMLIPLYQTLSLWPRIRSYRILYQDRNQSKSESLCHEMYYFRLLMKIFQVIWRCVLDSLRCYFIKIKLRSISLA